MNLLSRGDDEGEGGRFGENNFETLDDRIEDYKDTAVTSEAAAIAARELYDETRKMFRDSLASVSKALKPSFLIRYHAKKIHTMEIEDVEEDVDEMHKNTRATIEKEFKQHKIARSRAQKLKKKLAREANFREEIREAIHAAKQESQTRDVENYKQRRLLQIAETEAKAAAEAKAQVEAQEVQAGKTRAWRVNHWGRVAEEMKQEALETQATTLHKVQKEYREVVQKTYDEWADRDLSRARMQVEIGSLNDAGGDVSNGELGLFGTFGGPPAYFNVLDSVGHLENADIDESLFGDGAAELDFAMHDTFVFSSAPQTELEVAVNSLQTDEAETAQKQALYDSLGESSKELAAAMDRMKEMKDIAEKDKKQVNNELIMVQAEQNAHPRRLALPAEIHSTNFRKERIKKLENRIQEFSHSISIASSKKSKTDAQMLALAKELAVFKERDSQSKAAIADVNNGMGRLPMITGKSISKIDGLELLGKPKDLLDAVRHKSKHVGFEVLRDDVLKAHKARGIIDQQLWLSRQGSIEVKMEGERVLNRFAEIAEKLKTSVNESARLNLIDSLKVFLYRKVPLNKVVVKYAGPLPWLNYVNRKLSKSFCPYTSSKYDGIITFELDQDDGSTRTENSQSKATSRAVSVPASDASTAPASDQSSAPPPPSGLVSIGPDDMSAKQSGTERGDGESKISGVLLDSSQNLEFDPYTRGCTLCEGETSGYCVGVIKMPKDSMWNICIPISRQGTGEEYSGDESDFISVRIGLTLSSMSVIGTYFNQVDPVLGIVRHEVKHVIRGDTIVFRFDFSSSSTELQRHLAVGTGLYEERQMKALEVYPEKDSKGREIVLSSFVRNLRLDEKQGPSRQARLMEELVAVQESNVKHWDSTLLSVTAQRYEKEYFMRLLRAEILMEFRSNKSLYEEQQRTNNEMVEQVKSFQDIKLEISKQKYLARKRRLQMPIVEKGNNLVGRRLEILDPSQDLWRHVIVKECKVKWIENGTVAKIYHIAREIDENFDFIGREFLIDLAQVRYFDAATQQVDEQALAKGKENKKWERRLAAINLQAQTQIEELRTSFESFCQREEGAVRSLAAEKLRKFEERADQEAEEAIQSAVNKRAINGYVSVVMLDMKKGIVPTDISLPPGVQAKQIATERFMADWIQRQRDAIQKELDGSLEKLRRREAKKLAECREVQMKILKTSSIERYKLQQNIRERRAAEKARQLEMVRFDPEVFRKVTPQAQQCEHLRAKAWGDNYSSGVRCQVCKKEISNLCLEESQHLGIGSGTDMVLYNQVKQHREHEHAFRFKQASELERVHNERTRLEKERYILEAEDSHFYDFMDLKVIYKFDQRHSKEIKKWGLFRQGLQWTETELDLFVSNKFAEEKQRIKELGLVEEGLENFDALSMVEEPPPTMRGVDERKRAQFEELKFAMSRLENFRKRITSLKEERLDLLSDRAMFSFVLTSLHRDAYSFDSELENIESDLVKTGKLLQTFEAMKILWEQANRNLARARREKKKAEMKQVGLWDDVKECTDKVTYLHEETRALLKKKYLLDQTLEEQQRYLEMRRDRLDELRVKWAQKDKETSGFEYRQPGQPVMTKYGYCYIRTYRLRDDMVMVTLPFGNPPAKAWLLGKDIVQEERARQNAERLLMDYEDQAIRSFNSHERLVMRRELGAMSREEEGLKRFWQFLDLGKTEDSSLKHTVDEAVATSYIISGSKKFKKATKEEVEKRAKEHVAELKAELKGYSGPASGKPKIPGMWGIYKKKKEIANQIRQAYIEKAARKAEASIAAALYAKRFEWIQNHSFEMLMDQTIKEMIEEIAVESLLEGRSAKIAIEKVSGILFPSPWMQYSSYRSLSTIWKIRKHELQIQIDANKGLAAKVSNQKKSVEGRLDDKQLAALKERRRQRKLEKARQLKMCQEMMEEEARCRAFFKWELLENLRERRNMRDEDIASKQLRVEQKRLVEAAASTYAVSNASVEQQREAAKVTDFDRRRQELKEIALERRRREEDRAGMIVEDKRGEALREIDRLERQRKAFIAEFGIDESLIPADGSMDELMAVAASEGKQQQGSLAKPLAVKIPKWMKVPSTWNDWDVSRQMKYITFMTDIRFRNRVVAKKARGEEKRIDKLEKKSHKEWNENFSVHLQASLEAELEMMQSEEDAKEAESKLMDLQDNLRKMSIFCRTKGEEELHARTELRMKEELARRRDVELKEASDWVELCERRGKNRDKVKRKITSNCKWVDADSIAGFHQRFKTELLRKRLYEEYFRRTIYWIANRAEIIATERRLMGLQEKLTINRLQLDDRLTSMRSVWNSLQRKDLMRTKRSVLNLKFFPRHRRHLLTEIFQGWVRFYYWNRGHREAFSLKFEVLKRQQDIDRQFKDQLIGSKSERSKPDPSSKETFVTLMSRHRERPVQCRFCQTMYLEAQNTSLSCAYHSNVYVLCCPKTCASPGLTALCSAHRLRRWKCCDSTYANAPGCSRRYHQAEPSDATYDAVMEKVAERDVEHVSRIDEKLTLARKNNWAGQLHAVRQDQVFVAEDAMVKAREKVNRYYEENPRLRPTTVAEKEDLM